MARPFDPDAYPDDFPPDFAESLRKNAQLLDLSVNITPDELKALRDENAQLRQRVYNLEHELGLKKGYR